MRDGQVVPDNLSKGRIWREGGSGGYGAIGVESVEVSSRQVARKVRQSLKRECHVVQSQGN